MKLKVPGSALSNGRKGIAGTGSAACVNNVGYIMVVISVC